MCGLCTAGIFLQEYLFNRAKLLATFADGHKEFCPVNFCHYLFECSANDVGKLPSARLRSSLYVSCLCLRSGEQLLHGHHDFVKAGLLVLTETNKPLMFYDDTLEETLRNIGVCESHISGLSDLYQLKTYLNVSSWQSFYKCAEAWLASTKKLINYYVEWWIDGNGLQRNNLDNTFKEKGVFDPVLDVSSQEKKKFFLLLPVLSFSIDVIAKVNPCDSSLMRVALGFPAGVPEFAAFDLWLKRKALRYCFYYAKFRESEALYNEHNAIYLEYAANHQ